MKPQVLLKIAGVLLCNAVLNNSLQAQQQVTFTHYAFNTLVVNPAYAASDDVLTVHAISRNRWVSFPGAPRVQTVTIQSPLAQGKLGGGISFYNDSKGPTKTTGVTIDLSYRLKLGKGHLAFGLKGGVNSRSNYLNSQVDLTEENDIQFSTDQVGEMLPNVGFGVYYSSPKFFAGVSSPRLLTNSEALAFDGEQKHFYAMTGGTIKLSSTGLIKLKPSLLFKMTESTLFQADLTALVEFNNRFWVGPMYRSFSDAGLLMGAKFTEQFSFGYAFDWSMANPTRVYNNGSHELMLRYQFIYSNRDGIMSPRHF